MENKNLVVKVTAKIYPSAQREKSESVLFTRLSTFNFENSKGKFPPFGTLMALNDETIRGQNKIFRHIEQDTIIVILPLFGAVVYKDSLDNEDIIDTEQLRIFSAKKGMTYELTNPYRDGLINYLQIWIAPETNTFIADSQQQQFSYSRKNELFPLFSNEKASENVPTIPQSCFGYMGIYEDRKIGTYELLQPTNGLFAFVISGKFQFGNHELSPKDGISIVGNDKIMFESLTENGVILLLEVAMIV